MKKVLICEDTPSLAKALARSLLARNFDVETIVGKPQEIKDCIEKKVKDYQPDYAVIDGLNGECYEVAELAKKENPALTPVIFSGKDYLVDEAKKRGYTAFVKPDFNGLFGMLESS